MFILLSGEGPTDIGSAKGKSPICENEDFQKGPMAIIVEKIAESMKASARYGVVSKSQLTSESQKLKSFPKQLRLPGLRRNKETHYFFNNARSLARIAEKLAKSHNGHVVAVLFRDADGTASAERGNWEDKWDSMLKGFEAEGFERGVPMIPKPKSEAWLICAFKTQRYEGCHSLEKRSGNDGSPKSLKKELITLLNDKTDSQSLSTKVEKEFQVNSVDMPSFKAFRDRLNKVLKKN